MERDERGRELWELVATAQGGDTEAFGVLYKEYFTPVFRYLLSRLKSKEEAEDLAQTVFMKAFESLSRLEARGANPKAYFFAIARNALVDHWRTRKHTVSLDREEAMAETIAGDDNSDHTALAREAREALDRALVKLTGDQRDVVELRFFGGLSHDEVADALGKTSEAVRQLQVRALRELKNILESDGFK